MTIGNIRRKTACSVILLALVSAIVPGFGVFAKAETPGEQLYMDYCSVCHGENGDGNSRVRQGLVPPPRDFTIPGLKHTLSRERMTKIIRNGKPGTAMVGWSAQLTDKEITLVADYIVEKFMREKKDNPDLSNRGRQIYATTCSVCHGEEGRGAVWGRRSLDPPPVNFTDPHVQQKLTRERMLLSVTHGRPGTAMAAFGSQLSAEDIAATVDFIRAEFMETTRTPAQTAGVVSAPAGAHSAIRHRSVTADRSAQMPNQLVGDPAVGRGYYLQNCTACHGAAGDGKGPRAYFIFPKPRNFLDPDTRASFNRPRLFVAIRDGVVGKEMPAWGKVLDDQTIASIAEYVYQAFIDPKDMIAPPTADANMQAR